METWEEVGEADDGEGSWGGEKVKEAVIRGETGDWVVATEDGEGEEKEEERVWEEEE